MAQQRSKEELLADIGQALKHKDSVRENSLRLEYSDLANRENWGDNIRVHVAEAQLTSEQGTRTIIPVSINGPNEGLVKVRDAAKTLPGFEKSESTDNSIRINLDKGEVDIDTWLAKLKEIIRDCEQQPDTKSDVVPMGRIDTNPKK